MAQSNRHGAVHQAISDPMVAVKPGSAARAWRVLSLGSGAPFQGWDVSRVDIGFDRPTLVTRYFASGSGGPAAGPERAFDSTTAPWQGRLGPEAGGHVWLALELDRHAMPTSIRIKQDPTGHQSRGAVVQFFNGERWISIAHGLLASDGATELLARGQPPRCSAKRWRIRSQVVGSDTRWHVERVRLLTSLGEARGSVLSSGSEPASEPGRYASSHVMSDSPAMWRGRADSDARMWVEVESDTPVAVHRILLRQHADNGIDAADVEVFDDEAGIWSHYRHAFDLTPGVNDLIRHEPRCIPPIVAGALQATPTVPYRDHQQDVRILVMISSDRDADLANTIGSALAQAAYPEHLRFAIHHTFDDDTAGLLDRWKEDPRFEIDEVPQTESLGPAQSRARTAELMDGEPFILSVMSSARFGPRWDVRQVTALDALDEPLAVLSTPLQRFKEGASRGLRIDLEAIDTDLSMHYQLQPVASNTPEPSSLIDPDCFFTRGQFCHDIPFDPLLEPSGLMLSLSARAHTSGYELFNSAEVVVFASGESKSVLPDAAVTSGQGDQADFARLEQLFSGNAHLLGRYGLGPLRSLETFWHRTGIRPGEPNEVGQQHSVSRHPNSIEVRLTRHAIERREDYKAFVVVLFDRNGLEVERRSIHTPSVLDLSDDVVVIHGVSDIKRVVGHGIIPVGKDGAIGRMHLGFVTQRPWIEEEG